MNAQEIRDIIRSEIDRAFSDFLDPRSSVSVTEAARMLRCSRPTIYNMVKAGELEKSGQRILKKSIRDIQLRAL